MYDAPRPTVNKLGYSWGECATLTAVDFHTMISRAHFRHPTDSLGARCSEVGDTCGGAGGNDGAADGDSNACDFSSQERIQVHAARGEGHQPGSALRWWDLRLGGGGAGRPLSIGQADGLQQTTTASERASDTSVWWARAATIVRLLLLRILCWPPPPVRNKRPAGPCPPS